MKRTLLAMLVLAATAGAEAGMVTERWTAGAGGQHPKALTFRQTEQGGLLLAADLSALPKGATVYRARLSFDGASWKDASFDIFPAAGDPPKAVGDELPLPGPWFRWFDATDAVRKRPSGGTCLLWLKRHPTFDRDKTHLEIAYEGSPSKAPPRQVGGVKALYRSGQVFVTFREIDPPDGGKAEITAGELSKRLKVDYYRPRPTGGLRYRVYRHDEPITAGNIGRAELLGEVLPGSGYNTRHVHDPGARGGRQVPALGLNSKKAAKALAVRVAIEPGPIVEAGGAPRMRCRPLPPGTGVYVHTVTRPGKAYYAVLAASGAAVNTRDVSAANTAGPVDQRVADPEPVMYMDLTRRHGEAVYHRQHYSFWTTHPLSRVPARYDVVVSYSPERLLRPAPVRISRAQWGVQPVGYWPRARTPGSRALHLSHNADSPLEFRTGLNDAMDTLKGFDEGVWTPFHMNRQHALLKWMMRTWPVDPDRISVYAPCWGTLELRHGDVYSHIDGYVLAEMTKGFQTFERACAVWGEPKLYASRPEKPDPYRINDLSGFVLARPKQELPYVISRGGAGCHNRDMGWPPFPRFFWAMMASKRAFTYNPRRTLYEALRSGRIRLGRDRSLPAFAHCTLDDAIGDGDPWTSEWMVRGSWHDNSQLNGYLLWDSEGIADEPDTWAVTVWLAADAPLDACTVDVTPRRCRRFRAGPGRRFEWTNVLTAPPPGPKAAAGDDEGESKAKAPRPRPLGRGRAEADKHGLVTAEAVKVTKGRHRLTITRAR